MRQRFPNPMVMLLIFGMFLAGAIPATAASSNLHLAGLALHQETGRDIYLGGLYIARQAPTPANVVDAAAPRLMEYRVVARRTSIRSLLGGMLLQSQVATGNAPDGTTTDFAKRILSIVKSSLYAGDSFEVMLNMQNETVAYLNGQELTRVNGRAVSDYLLLGWVGERSPATTFRDSIMSIEINPTLLAALEGNTYSSERGAQIASWVDPPHNSPDSATAATATGTELKLPATEIAQVNPVPDPAGPAVSQEAIQVASNGIQSLGVQEYSQRLSNFHSHLVAMVYGQIKYPRQAVKRGLQGRLELDVTLLEDGELVEINVVRPSGHGILDRAAIKATQNALSSGGLTSIDPVAIAEFSRGKDGNLVIPVPVNFMLTE